MHHPRAISDVRRLRIASLLLLGNRFLILASAGILLLSIVASDQQLMIYGSSLVAVCLVLMIAQWIAASHAGCPLCRTPVLAPMGCAKHRKAKRLLGCYRLRVAFAIMFTERFRCPYCNEPTSMDVRERLRGSSPRGSDPNGFPKPR